MPFLVILIKLPFEIARKKIVNLIFDIIDLLSLFSSTKSIKHDIVP